VRCLVNGQRNHEDDELKEESEVIESPQQRQRTTALAIPPCALESTAGTAPAPRFVP
jgi:hypothetical protein